MAITHRTWATTFLTNGTVLLLGVVTGVFSARMLLPTGRGQLAIILFWPMLFQGIGMLGLKEAVTRRISNGTGDIHVTVASALWLGMVYAVITCAIGYLAIPLLLGAIHQDLVEITRSYMLLLTPFGFVILCLRSADQGRMNFSWLNTLVVSVPSIYLLLLVALWLAGGFSVKNVVWANVASVILVSLVRIVLGWKWIISYPSVAVVRELFFSGLRFYLTAMVMLIGSQADRLVLVKFWDNKSIGLYMVALTIASTGIGALSNSFQTIVFPHMGSLSNEEARHDFLAQKLRYAMVLLTGLALTIICLSPWVIPMLFGHEFAASVYPAMVLTLALVPFSLRQILIAALRGLGEAGPGTVSEVIALVVFVSLMFLTGKFIGLSGVALAMLAANIVSVGYLYRYVNSRMKLNVKDWWGVNVVTAVQVFRIGRLFILGR